MMTKTRSIWSSTCAALLLMAGVAMLLARQRDLQRLGNPGVRVVAHSVLDPDGVVVGTNTIPLPERVLDWESEELPVDRVVVEWLPRDTTYAQRMYRAKDGFPMQVNVVLMGADRTSIHKPEYCLVGSGWKNHEYGQAEILIRDPHPYRLPVSKILCTRRTRTPAGETQVLRGVYVYWFVAENQVTARHGERMWSMARNLLLKGVLQRWAYVSAFSWCAPGAEDATFDRMKESLAAMVPTFQLATGRPVAEGASSPASPGAARSTGADPAQALWDRRPPPSGPTAVAVD